MVLDETDTCIITCFPSMMGYFPVRLSFQIMSDFIDTFVKFSNFMSRGWGF